MRETTGSPHLERVLGDIQQFVDRDVVREFETAGESGRAAVLDGVSKQNVRCVVRSILDRSEILRRLDGEGRIAVVGAFYDVATGAVEFLERDQARVAEPPDVAACRA